MWTLHTWKQALGKHFLLLELDSFALALTVSGALLKVGHYHKFTH